MEKMIMIPILLVLAISLQCFLALKQGKALGDTFSDMRRNGNVLVGKYKSRMKGGAYILFNITPDGKVTDARSISGRTVFSKIDELPQCIGQDIYKLAFETYCVQKAYENAILHYREESKGIGR